MHFISASTIVECVSTVYHLYCRAFEWLAESTRKLRLDDAECERGSKRLRGQLFPLYAEAELLYFKRWYGVLKILG